MARSYRKPFVTQGYGSQGRKWSKNQANRRVRRSQDVPSGKAYRKFYDSWNIVDWIFEIPKPIKGGRYGSYFHWETEEQMIKNYRKARRK